MFAFSSLTTRVLLLKDADFNVVARLESFNKGHGVEEAFRRAEAYHATGVDAILCHSKREDDSDIRAFMADWGTKRCPVVIVPPQNWKVPSSEVAAQGVSTDSLLKDACACISDTVPGGSGHVPTANEGTAVAAATGHHVATGKTSMVRCLPRVKVLYLP